MGDLTPEEESKLRERVAGLGLCRVDADGLCETHSEIAFGDNECEDSPLETARLLATLDAERARTVVLTDALRDTFGAVAFLQSVVASGEHLNTEDNERLDDTLELANRALEAAVLPVDRVGVEPLDVAKLNRAILDELAVLWGEPSDGISAQVRPIVAANIAERYATRLIESPTEGET